MSESEALRAVRRALRWMRKAEEALKAAERQERRAALHRSQYHAPKSLSEKITKLVGAPPADELGPEDQP